MQVVRWLLGHLMLIMLVAALVYVYWNREPLGLVDPPVAAVAEPPRETPAPAAAAAEPDPPPPLAEAPPAVLPAEPPGGVADPDPQPEPLPTEPVAAPAADPVTAEAAFAEPSGRSEPAWPAAPGPSPVDAGVDPASAGFLPPPPGPDAAEQATVASADGVEPADPLVAPETEPVQVQTPAELLESARRAYWEGRPDEAVGAYRALLRLQPDEVTAWLELGSVLAEGKRRSEGADALANAAELLVRQGRAWEIPLLINQVFALDYARGRELERVLATLQAAPGWH